MNRHHRMGIDWWIMKTTQSSDTSSDHQAVAETFEFKTQGKAIAIAFTEQQLSPHAGSVLFWGWLHRLNWCRRLAAALPHPPAAFQQQTPAGGEGAGIDVGVALRSAQANPCGVSAARSGVARTIGNSPGGEPVGVVAVLSRFWLGGRQPALVPSALASVPGPAAQPQGRLYAGIGFDAAAP